jgi:hypothetical protein
MIDTPSSTDAYTGTPTPVPVHAHNGIDSNTLDIKDIVPIQTAITAPSGGATIDTQARTAITDIINKLKALGLTL